MDKKTAQTAVMSDEKPRRSRLRIKLSTKSGLIVFLVCLLIILVGWRLYESHTSNTTVVIGGTHITQAEINAYAAEIQRYSTAEHESFGGTPTQVADNDLILNAALKDQASKHHITLTQAETNKALQYKYNAYGSRQAYQAALRNLGIVDIMKIRDQNIAYESILQNILIAKKQVFMAGIYYDSPYFGKSKDPAVLRAQATKIMQTQFLPLFKKHLSRQAIDKQTTVGTITPNTSATPAQTELFFTGMPVTDMYIPNYSASDPTFDEAGTSPIKGVKSANQAIDSLTKVGQYTQVETFKPGFIGILRLEGQTNGAYSSWNQLLQQYKSKYASKLAYSQSTHPAFAQMLLGKLVEPFAALLHASQLLVFPKAYATNFNDNSQCIIPPIDGTYQTHFATFWIRSFDITTGASIESGASQIGGAYVTETRAQAQCVNRNDLLIENGDPNLGTTSASSNLVFEDNCWNVAPAWSQTPPSNSNGSYTWDPGNDYSTNIGIDQTNTDSNYGWPNWDNGNINIVKSVILELAYTPPQIVIKWRLQAGTSYGPTTVAPGQPVSFASYVENEPYPASLNNATYTWQIEASLDGAPFTDIVGPILAASIPPGEKAPNNTNGPIPWSSTTSDPDGSKYCQKIVYTDATGPGTASADTGNTNCVTLKRVLTVTCNTTYVPEPNVVQQGDNINVPPGNPTDNNPPTNPDSWSNPQPPKSPDPGIQSGALITITGTDLSAAQSSFWQGQHPSNPGPGWTTAASYTANYSPTSANVTVTIVYYENALTHLGGNEWVVVSAPTPTTLNCLTPTPINPGNAACSLSVSGGDGPGGVITVGQTISVTGVIYNPAGANNIALPASLPDGGLNLTFSGTDYAWGSSIPVGGSSGTISLGTITATAGPTPSTQSIGVWVAYGGTQFGPNCSISFPVYAPFSLTPNSSATLAPDPEDPTSVNNDTYVTEGGAAVSETVTSNLYEVKSGSSTEIANGNTSSGGPFDPGTTTCLYESPAPYTVAGCNPPLTNGVYTPSTPLKAGDTYCAVINVPTTTVGSNIAYVGPTGDIVGGAAASSSSCPQVVNKPYFKVYGSGALAGGSFSGTPSPNGGILASWNNDAYSAYDYGAGSELSNIAAGPITGFAAGQQSSDDVRNPLDLTYANSVNGGGTDLDYTPNIGGDYVAGGSFALLGEGALPNPAAWSGSSSPSGGNYLASGGTVLSGITVCPGQNVYLHVTGNVYIDGDIKLDGANASDSSCTTNSWSITDVPSFILNVTGGNIYIDPSVGELDGTYIAEPNTGNGGTIYTCGVNSGGGSFAAMSSSLLFSGCNQQLTVYGSFEAQSVNLMRTYGTLRDETPTPAGSKTGPTIDQSVEFDRYDCPNAGNGTLPGVHFYQNTGNSEPVMNQTCNYEGILGYILPAPLTAAQGYCDTTGAAPLWYYQDPDGDNFYTQDTAEPHTSVIGCAAPWAAPGTIPIYRFSASDSSLQGFHFYTNNCTELTVSIGATAVTCNSTVDSPGLDGIQYDGIGFYLYAAAGQGGMSTSTPVAAGPPPGLGTQCSNDGGRTSPRPTCAAEVFDYSPAEMYLSSPTTTPSYESTNSAIQIYNLPPVL